LVACFSHGSRRCGARLSFYLPAAVKAAFASAAAAANTAAVVIYPAAGPGDIHVITGLARLGKSG
jgi:hypothetical protein